MAKQKFKRGNSPPFVKLEHWLMNCDAWLALKPGPRALYTELKKRFKGGNNGEIFLSHRDAANALGVGRDTVGAYYKKLLEHGFIIETRGHCLGPAGIGQSSSYALTELPLGERPATKEFMRWKKQNPRKKTRHSLAGKSGHPCRETQHSQSQKSENPAALAQNRDETMSENPAIYSSNHVPSEKSSVSA